MIRFRFVDDTRTDYPVKRICEVLDVNRASYYKWRQAKPTRDKAVMDDAVLCAMITTIFEEENGCYGAKRIAIVLTRRLRETDPDHPGINHKKVARLMRMLGIAGYSKARVVTTTRSKRGGSTFADLVCRKFDSDQANKVYVGDITYLPIAGGSNMYLATVIDCFSRKLVGFAIADHMRTSLVEEALTMAKGIRGNLQGAIFHSDHGSVYTSAAYRQLCEKFGVTQSMGAVGTSADNALAESFNSALKREVLQDRKVFDNHLVCRREVFYWCTRYNTHRLHTWCGYLSPDDYEAAA